MYAIHRVIIQDSLHSKHTQYHVYFTLKNDTYIIFTYYFLLLTGLYVYSNHLEKGSQCILINYSSININDISYGTSNNSTKR